MRKEINILLTPDNDNNWLVDIRSKDDEDKYSKFYKGILLANASDVEFYEEVTPEWKQEHEYIEPIPVEPIPE